MAFNKNGFGELVKAYRKQCGYTQEELAHLWGHSRGYVAQIEQGQRKLDNMVQVVRLADILNIPQEKLEAIGKGIPARKSDVQASSFSDQAILHTLLASSRETVRLSYLIWLADQSPLIEEQVRELILKLGFALTTAHGEMVKPAQQLLAYAHQMLGKIAFDRLDYAAAGGHFSEMIDLGQILNDAHIISLGMIRQGDVLRKKGRYETALRCFEAAKPYADATDQSIQGLRYINIARSYYFLGDEKKFLQSIHPALDIATHMKKESERFAYWFNLDVVLQFQASGYTALRKPEKAIEIYQQIERSRPFRPLRDQGAYTIEKARAYLEVGDVATGLDLSLKGLQMASEYRSKRHITRLEATYNHLLTTPFGKEKKIRTLRDALREAQSKQIDP